jgi:hypothetical protein
MHQVGKKSDDSNDSFCEELEKFFDHFLKQNMNIFGDFKEKMGREGIFKIHVAFN